MLCKRVKACECVCVFTRENKMDEDGERSKERVGCVCVCVWGGLYCSRFSSFCFTLAPSSSLAATCLAFISLSHRPQRGKAVFSTRSPCVCVCLRACSCTPFRKSPSG